MIIKKILLSSLVLLLNFIPMFAIETQTIDLGTKKAGETIYCKVQTTNSILTTQWNCYGSASYEFMSKEKKFCGVKLLKQGELTITATIQHYNGGGAIYNFKCKVLPAPLEAVLISPYGNENELDIGGSLTLTAEPYPSYAEATSFQWSVDDPSILSLSSTRYESTKITAKSAGNTTVRVMVNGTKSESRKVKVYGNNPTALSIPNSKNMTTGESETIQVSFVPSTTRTPLTWSSDRPSVATVSNDGTIIALSPGTAKIKVETTNHVSATMLLQVKEIPLQIESCFPNNSTNDQDVLTAPYIVFNQEIKLRDDIDHFTLKSAHNDVIFKAICFGNQLMGTLDKALLPNTKYTLEIPQGTILSKWGTEQNNDIRVTFTTSSLREMSLTASVFSGTYVNKGSTVELSASQSDARIYYTLDGTEPTENSILYVTPIKIDNDVTLWAKAFLDGYEIPTIKNIYKISILKLKKRFPGGKDKLYTYKDVNPCVEFSVDITKSEEFENIQFTTLSGESVEGQFIIYGNRLVFVPVKGLTDEKTYKFVIPYNAVKANNNEPNNNIDWKFDTGTYIDSISAGFRMGMALTNTHTMHWWGWSEFSDLLEVISTPDLYQLDGISQISAGYMHNMALSNDQKLYGYGRQYCGEMGKGDYAETKAPSLINLQCDKVFCGGQNTAIIKDGQLYMAGRNDYKQIEDYDDINDDSFSQFTKVTTNRNIVQKVIPSLNNTFFLTDKGTLFGMGNSMNNLLFDRFNGLYNYHDIMSYVKDFAACKWASTNVAVITEDDKLLMWGTDKYGLLGTGKDISYENPIEIMEDVKSVSLGIDCAAAIKKDGTLWMWGKSTHGQLTDKITNDTSTPQLVMKDVKNVEIGDHYVLALKEDGSLWSWGCNKYAQLGRSLKQDFEFNVDIDDSKPGLVMAGKDFADLDSVKILDQLITLNIGEKAVILAQTVPLNANYKEWNWSIDNSDIVSVDNRGIVTAKASGNTMLTLTSDKGVSATCQIIVNATSGIVNIETKKDSTVFDIYDLQGRKIKSKVKTTNGIKAGLYIINGKKVLIK